MRLRLLIAYDGRPFRGWQSQSTNDSIQDFIEAAFAKILDAPASVTGSGRTDAGVHALGQVAHVDVPDGSLALERWAPALNANLPPEIRILRAAQAKPRFHARFDATGKIYTYRLWNGPCLHPLELGRAWLIPGELDLAALRAGANLLQGTHDFAGFAANRGKPEEDTTRTIYRIGLARRSGALELRFHGNGFMYKMVRLLTGSLVRCAQGRADTAWLASLLEARDGRKTQFAAPADGLYLTRVLY